MTVFHVAGDPAAARKALIEAGLPTARGRLVERPATHELIAGDYAPAVCRMKAELERIEGAARE